LLPYRHGPSAGRTRLRDLVRAFGIASLGVAVVAIVALAHPSVGAAAPLDAKLAPATGAHFGIFSGPPRSGRKWGQEVPYLESVIARKYDLDRWYYFWDETFPTWHEKDAAAAGRIPVVGWSAGIKAGSTARDGTPVRFAAIANGAEDARIRARADALKAFGHKVMFIFHHEPEDEGPTHGTPAEYKAAYRRVVSIFRQRGATNVIFVWNMMSWTFNPGGAVPENWYPGDDVVDWVAADGYNWYENDFNPGPWREFSEIFYHFRLWAKAKGKPAMVAEVGSGEDPANATRKAKWFANALTTIKSWPEIKAFIYFNSLGWHFDATTASTNAYRTVARDPYFNPRTTTSADSTRPTVSVTSPANGSTVTSKTTVRIAANAGDNVAVSSVQFWANGQLKCTDSVAPYTCDWYVWNTPGATNWIKAVASDAAGNTATHSISTGTR
jgi:hypothetical protein